MSSAAVRLLAEGDPAAGMEPSDVTAPEQKCTWEITETLRKFYMIVG